MKSYIFIVNWSVVRWCVWPGLNIGMAYTPSNSGHIF